MTKWCQKIDRTLGNKRDWERGPKETVERSEGREELEKNIEEHKQRGCPLRDSQIRRTWGKTSETEETGGKDNQGITGGAKEF